MFEAVIDIERGKTIEISSSLPESLRPLEKLAWNYWWTWAADGESLFRDLDPEVWEECEHNPRALVRRTSEFRLTQMAVDPVYKSRVTKVSKEFEKYIGGERASTSPFAQALTPERPVAYFCAEYGIHNSLPLYSGGLGMLAGDHLKSASDLHLPLVAVGLLYRYGYFRQRLRRDGWQEEFYGETHPSTLPIRLATDPKGERVVVEVSMRNRPVKAQVWRAEVGRVSLYLLDTNIPENDETDRLVTGHLYGGDRETRLVQEMMLGIGGVRLLCQLGISPSVFHLNEGHSALLTLELAREVIASKHVSFAEAAAIVRARCVFTTHTPVAAGNDVFDAELVEKCFGDSFEQSLGLSHDEFLNLGRVNRDDAAEAYGMTALAIRMCRSTNGVSRKHGEVSRALWQKMWIGRTLTEVPITSITNGVHAPTWVAPLLRALYEKYIGADWAKIARSSVEWKLGVARIPDQDIWNTHRLLKQHLIAFIRHRSFYARLDRGETMDYVESAKTMLDHEVLTIGFARRVAGYKRWSLLLADPNRLIRLINAPERPVQFIFAGKAHPQDQGAKFLLQQIAQWQYDPLVRGKATFLQDYDQAIARQLVRAVDVWLNVPRRPLEASGTSGEKVAMNGGLNLSILDGWWIEGYDSANGFAIGDMREDTESGDVDAGDAESLYKVLEEEVVPCYYERNNEGLPLRWIAMMRHSLETLIPAFNSDRMVEEYARRVYDDGVH